jgi:hypothetical protein
MADDWKRRSDLKSWAISRTWKGGRRVSQLKEVGSTRSHLTAMRTYQTLEGELADEKLGRLLVAANLTESDGTGLVAVRLLDATGRGRRLAGSLGSELLTRGLATGGLAGGLLGASHF